MIDDKRTSLLFFGILFPNIRLVNEIGRVGDFKEKRFVSPRDLAADKKKPGI
jgi:hypothetical protein